MPEVNEVYIMSFQVNEKFQNKYLHKVNFNIPPCRWTNNCAYENREQLQKLLPLKLIKSYSKGKKVILELENNNYLVFSPLMSGGLTREKTEYGHWNFEFNTEGTENNHATEQSEAKLNDEKSEFVYMEDVRKRMLLNVYFDKTSFNKKMNEIGPDYVNIHVTLEYFTNKIKNKRIKTNEVGTFIVNPKYMSGIGNYLRAEILYDCKISPYRTLEKLSDEDINNLYNSIYKIIELSAKGSGLTIKNYKTFEGEKGTYEPLVYGKEKDPLGNVVVAGKMKGKDQTMYYVPEVQK
jgi:formamidopyrimidine-DNA glycosylase